MTDYDAIKIFNQKNKLIDYLALPMVPSVEMMLAAAERRDVYTPGDRLGDYIIAWDKEDDDAIPAVPVSLVSEYGMQRAFEICTLADGWAGCVSGFAEWQRQRGRDGATPFVNSWLRAVPSGCPKDGWPTIRAECSDEHIAHARSAEVANAASHSHWWWELDRRRVFHGPSHCLGIMGLRGRQAESATSLFTTFEELVTHETMPYVPGYTKEHYFDDEERSALVLSAMWDAAVKSLVSTEFHRAMPVDVRSNASRLIAEMQPWSKFRQNWSGFYRDAPHRRLEITTEGGRFEAAVSDTGIDWEVEFFESGEVTRRRSADFRLSPDADLFGELLRVLDSHVGIRFVSEGLR